MSATKPSIRGRIFAPAMEDLRKLVAHGVVSREDLKRWLGPSDLKLYDAELLEIEWYDVRAYGHLLAALRDLEGHGDDDYLRARGARSAERLLNAGLYQQLEYLDRLQSKGFESSEQRFVAFGKDLKLLSSISAAIFNFTKWTTKVDPDQSRRYRIEISEALDFPDPLALTLEGFVNRMARQHGDPDLWRIERARPDLFVLKMIREL
ncbi:MAG TPA: hypothetical protein VMW35_20740 [Myxococcota bacterium]|nr:hypothetical protein [Myxococcota bacterium]